MNVEQVQAAYNQQILEMAALNEVIDDRNAELARLRPMAAAAHTFCSVWLANEPLATVMKAHTAMLDVHREQTPEVSS